MQPDSIASLNDSEVERYSRQIILPQLGGAGQQKLKTSKILVIGAGGLGTPVLQYLSAAGIGELGIVDSDQVELSNLQRQIIHSTNNIGQAKTKSAAAFIHDLNPHIKIREYRLRLDINNAKEIFAHYDIIIDCCDNFATRYIITDMAELMAKPCISAAISRFDGMITSLAPYKDNNPSYRDLFPELTENQFLPTCATNGVMGAIAGIIGSIQAMEAIKLAAGLNNSLVGKLLIYHGLQARFQLIRYKRNY